MANMSVRKIFATRLGDCFGGLSHCNDLARTLAITQSGLHIVFGKVVEGLEVVDAIEKVGSQSGATSQKVIIKDCGELK